MNKQNTALLKSVPKMELFSSDLPEYAAALQTLLRSTDERIYIKQMLDQLLSGFSQNAIAVDWGAGSGALTHELLQRFSIVYRPPA